MRHSSMIFSFRSDTSILFMLYSLIDCLTPYPIPLLSSYPLPLTSYLLPLTSYLLPLTSYLLPLTSYLLPLTSYLLPLTSYPLPQNLKFHVTLGKIGNRETWYAFTCNVPL